MKESVDCYAHEDPKLCEDGTRPVLMLRTCERHCCHTDGAKQQLRTATGQSSRVAFNALRNNSSLLPHGVFHGYKRLARIRSAIGADPSAPRARVPASAAGEHAWHRRASEKQARERCVLRAAASRATPRNS